MLLPISVLNKTNKSFSLSRFCELLGFNRQAKYFMAAIVNRTKYNTFLGLNGEIMIGDKVMCRGGSGELVARGDDGTVTIKLLPWGTVKEYRSSMSAQMKRLEPSLDQFERLQRSDVTPDSHKKTIDAFFRKHVPQSPNKRDTLKMRHPTWPTQYKEAQALHRFESMSELWVKFMSEYPELYVLYKNDKLPYTAPRVFRENAPWEMIKAPDQSCLCVNCEGMVNLLRGSAAACSAIDSILDKAATSRDADTVELAKVLRKIKAIITSPSKTAALVACLGDCLPSGKIEDAKFDCIYGLCDDCGFDKLWSDGLRKILIDENDKPIPNAPLCGPDWEAVNIDWRYFTHSIAPTEANRARESADKAASARAAARTTVDADDDEYDGSDAKTKPTRNLVLATKRGNLINFSDELELKLSGHLIHKSIVETEFKAKTNYDQNLRPLIMNRNIDFAENGAMKNKREVQSQYWVTIGYTLFVSICMWLSVDAWNSVDSAL